MRKHAGFPMIQEMHLYGGSHRMMGLFELALIGQHRQLIAPLARSCGKEPVAVS